MKSFCMKRASSTCPSSSSTNPPAPLLSILIFASLLLPTATRPLPRPSQNRQPPSLTPPPLWTPPRNRHRASTRSRSSSAPVNHRLTPCTMTQKPLHHYCLPSSPTIALARQSSAPSRRFYELSSVFLQF